MNVFTWHVHGSYLYYLSHIPHQIFVPIDEQRSKFHTGKGYDYPWPENVHEIPLNEIPLQSFDCVLFQHRDNFLTGQYRALSERQRNELPAIVLEHDPPRDSPTNTVHYAAKSGAKIIHVTDFNALMWDNGTAPVSVIEHGIPLRRNNPYLGHLPRGIVAINNLRSRGRRLGLDIYLRAREQVPLELVGIDSLSLPGGLGAVLNSELELFYSHYRFFFSPIRYTSLGLSTLEAMAAGVPVVALSTTELTTVIMSGMNGFAHTAFDELIDSMEHLLGDPALARRMGEASRSTIRERFSMQRFVQSWCDALTEVADRRVAPLQKEVVQ